MKNLWDIIILFIKNKNFIIYSIFFTFEVFHIICTAWYNKQNLSIKKLRIAILNNTTLFIAILLKASMKAYT